MTEEEFNLVKEAFNKSDSFKHWLFGWFSGELRNSEGLFAEAILERVKAESGNGE